jgi:sulfur-oxidizing protein SoxY
MEERMMNPLRRTFLKSTGAAGTVAVAIAAGLLRPGQVLAAEWNKAAFDATTTADAMKGLSVAGAAESKDILIKAPDIAENGAVVPVEVTSKIPGTTSIMIFVDKNQNPLIADFEFSNGAEGYVSTRIKMANTSHVRVAVKAGGKAYTATKEVKVTIGGCGG